MTRFVALYRMPADAASAAAFEERYRAAHLPLVAGTPGLVAAEVSRVARTFHGEPALLIAVLTFADDSAMKAALRSPEWAAAGANLAEIGGLDLVTMLGLEEPKPIPLPQPQDPNQQGENR